MALTVIGIFDDANDAQQAVEALVDGGFSRSNIDISTGRYADATGTGSVTTNQPDLYADTSGAQTGRTADDEKEGGIGGFFKSLFGGDDDDDDRQRYATVADQGSVVTVHAQTEDEAEQAADILDDNGAVDVDERAAEYNYTGATNLGTGTDVSGNMGTGFGITASDNLTTDTNRLTTDNDQTIKVIEENLEVGKREIERGGVRVRSRIIERPVEESVRLREERVLVRRNPVNRPATADDLNAFQEGEITMTEHAEVPVVSKTANVVEEITVGKEVNEREEVIQDTVRRTDVEVDPITSTEQNLRTSDQSLGTDNDVTYPAR